MLLIGSIFTTDPHYVNIKHNPVAIASTKHISIVV